MCWFVQKVSAKGDSDPAVTQPWDECHSSSAADIKRVQSFFLPIPLTFYTALSCYSRCFPVWSNSVKHQDSRELLQLSCSSLLCSNENEKRFTVRQVTVNSGCDALWMILMDDPLCAAPHTLPQQTQNISRVQKLQQNYFERVFSFMGLREDGQRAMAMVIHVVLPSWSWQ